MKKSTMHIEFNFQAPRNEAEQTDLLKTLYGVPDTDELVEAIKARIFARRKEKVKEEYYGADEWSK